MTCEVFTPSGALRHLREAYSKSAPKSDWGSSDLGEGKGRGLESFEFVLVGPLFFGLGLLEVQRAARHVEVLRLAFAGE